MNPCTGPYKNNNNKVLEVLENSDLKILKMAVLNWNQFFKKIVKSLT